MVEPLTGGIIGVVLLLAFLFVGVPVCVGLGFSGLLAILLIEGPQGAFLSIGNMVYTSVWSITLLAIPLFIFMGNLVTQHGLGQDLYNASYKWLGRLPGGLAIASTVFSAIFGFMCGSGMAGAATIGGIAIPEMERRGYNRRFALGTLAMGGTLSSLIPPSVIMIIYAALASVSMGALFVAGILPGLLLAGLMCFYILAICAWKPALGPPGDSYSLSDKLRSSIGFVPAIALFIAVIGGIYMGIWSPIEAAAAACLVVILIVAAYRRLSWPRVKGAAVEATKTGVMIYMLVVGAQILSLLFFVSGLSDVIKHWMVLFALPRWGVILVILFVMMFMGMFMDTMALILISIPITLPTIIALGYDPVWWGILVIVSCEMCMITPPVGLNLFVIQGIAPKGTTLADVGLGAAPFVGVLWVFIALLIAFPDIALFLPRIMPR